MKKARITVCLGLMLSMHFAWSRAAEPDALNSLLEEESLGHAVQRRSLVPEHPRDRFTSWQRGLLEVDDRWLPVEELSGALRDLAYETKRDALQSKPGCHLMLARWCVRHDFPARARAHYFAVLAEDSHHQEARKYLGHVLVDGNWVEQAAFASARHAYRESLDRLEQWTPTLHEIVSGLREGNARRMTQALDALATLDTASALPAIEFFASNIDDDLARPLVRKLAELQTQEACQALVRIALAHPNPTVQEQAITAIRGYPEHFYVPGLLAMLRTEKQVRGELVMHPNGHIGLETVVTNELQDRKQLQRYQQLVSVVAKFSSSHSISLNTETFGDISYWSNFWNVSKSDPVEVGRLEDKKFSRLASSGLKMKYVPQTVALTAAWNLREHAWQQERALAAENRVLKAQVNRVCSLLRRATGESHADDARVWWAWWNDRNERYQEFKPTAYAFSQQRGALEIGTYSQSSVTENNQYDFGDMMIQYSCLVPGTLVQTSTGLVPIEQIKIGDLVLAQSAETAELSLKPVILTTVRPPKETLEITTSEGTIEATGGHWWWVSGRGWQKTRDLKPDMMFHTATGTLAVKDVKPSGREVSTHNLVVDDFHTYFVGSERVLSYDNSLLQPTLKRVPGYQGAALSAVDK